MQSQRSSRSVSLEEMQGDPSRRQRPDESPGSVHAGVGWVADGQPIPIGTNAKKYLGGSCGLTLWPEVREHSTHNSVRGVGAFLHHVDDRVA